MIVAMRFIAAQKHRVTEASRLELRRRPAVEPVNARVEEDHSVGRNFLTNAAVGA